MAAIGGLRCRPGAFAVNAPALNLLRYPRRGWLEPQLWWPLLQALGVGAVLGAACALGQHGWLDHLQTQRGQLQSQAHTVARQRAADAARQAQVQRLLAVHARAQDWQTQQAMGLRLQAALSAQGQALGLRVLRWQGDGRQILLQAWLPRVQDVPALVAGLSALGAGPWTVQSLSDGTTVAPQRREKEASAGAAGGVLVQLQAPWAPATREKGQSAP